LDGAPNLGPLKSRCENYKFENCWYKSVRNLEVQKLLFQQFSNFSSSQQDMSGPILGNLSNNRWSGGYISEDLQNRITPGIIWRWIGNEEVYIHNLKHHIVFLYIIILTKMLRRMPKKFMFDVMRLLFWALRVNG
jgi:hypothetical protein